MKYYPVVGLTPQERHNLIGNLFVRFEFDKTMDFDFDEATDLFWVAVKAPFGVIDDTLCYDPNMSLVNKDLVLTAQEKELVCVIAKKNGIDSFVDFDALKTCGQNHAALFYREVRVEINNHFMPELRNEINDLLNQLKHIIPELCNEINDLLIQLKHSEWSQDSLNTLEAMLTQALDERTARLGNASAKEMDVLKICRAIVYDINQLNRIYSTGTKRQDREAYFSALSTLQVTSVTLDLLKERLSPITKAYYDRDADTMLAYFLQQEKVMAAEKACSSIGNSPRSVIFSPSVSPVVITDTNAMEVDDENKDKVITFPDGYIADVSKFV